MILACFSQARLWKLNNRKYFWLPNLAPVMLCCFSCFTLEALSGRHALSCLHVTAYLPPALPAVPDLPGARWAQSAIYTALSNNGINGLLSLHALMLNAQMCWAMYDQNAYYREGFSKQLDCVYFPDYSSCLWRFLSWQHLTLGVQWGKLLSWHFPYSRMVMFACILKNISC